jgi:hypothetical protein
MFNKVCEAKSAFEDLPSDVRSKFRNDPVNLDSPNKRGWTYGEGLWAKPNFLIISGLDCDFDTVILHI